MYSSLVHASTSISLALLDLSTVRVTTCQKSTQYKSIYYNFHSITMYSSLVHASTSISLALLDLSTVRVTTCQKSTQYKSILLAIREEFETGLNSLNIEPQNMTTFLLRMLLRLDMALQFAVDGSVYHNMSDCSRLQTRLSLLRTFMTEAANFPPHLSTAPIRMALAPRDLKNIAKKYGDSDGNQLGASGSKKTC